ncbi:hypothetical protein AGMMS49921_11120 [Endomicrobiia bacterium]|nr:hypothetical protein AGMMS49921_11120 [Endomicrobiia bacterium]
MFEKPLKSYMLANKIRGVCRQRMCRKKDRGKKIRKINEDLRYTDTPKGIHKQANKQKTQRKKTR